MTIDEKTLLPPESVTDGFLSELQNVSETNAEPYVMFLLSQAFGYRSCNDNFIKSNDKIYKIVSSLLFSILGTLICGLQFGISIMEPASVLFESKNNKSILPLWVANLLELFCVIGHNIALVIHYLGCGCVRQKLILFWVLCGISYLGIIISFADKKMFRFHRISRPFYIFIYWINLRWWFYIFIRAPKTFLIFTPFYSLWLFITAMVIYAVYNPRALKFFPKLKDVEVPEFKSLGSTYHFTVWFELGFTQPFQWGNIANHNQFHAYFWVVLQVVLYLFLHNMALTLIVNNYNDCIEADFERSRKNTSIKLKQVWSALMKFGIIGRDTMRRETFLYIMERYYESHSIRNIENLETHIQVLYGLTIGNHATTNVLTVQQWNTLSDVAFLHWNLEPIIKEQNIFEIIITYSIFIGDVELIVLDLFYIVLTMIQCIIIVGAFDRRQSQDSKAELAIIFVINIFHILHMIVTILGEGIHYFGSIHLIDCIITLAGLVILFWYRNFMEHIGMKDSIQIFRLFTVLWFFGRNVSVLQKGVDSLGVSIKMVLKAALIIFTFQLMFGFIGMEIYGNLTDYVDYNRNTNDAKVFDNWTNNLSNPDDRDPASSQNFDKLYRMIPLLYIYLTENNAAAWNFWYLSMYTQCSNKCGSFLQKYGPGISIMFGIILYYFLILICANLIIAIFMDGFMGTFNAEQSIKRDQYQYQLNNQINALKITDYKAVIMEGSQNYNFSCIEDETVRIPFWND